MKYILRIIPVIIGWIIWRKTGSIFIGAFVAFALESFLAVVGRTLFGGGKKQ